MQAKHRARCRRTRHKRASSPIREFRKIGAAILVVLAGGGLLPGGDGPAKCRGAENEPVEKAALRYDGKDLDWWKNQLRTELKPELRVEAIRAMSAFGANGYGDEAARAIIEVIKQYDTRSPDKDERIVTSAAERAFRKIGPAAVPVLVKAMSDPDSGIRRYSAGILRRLRPGKAVVPTLVKAAKDEDPGVRQSAVLAVPANAEEAMREIAVEALIDALNDSDRETRRFAAQGLGQIGTSGTPAVPALISALTDEHHSVRQDAVFALGRIRPNLKSAPKSVKDAVEKEDRQLVVPALAETLKDENRSVRQHAIEVLGSIGPTAIAAVPSLIDAFGKVDPHDRFLIARALGKIGPGAGDALPLLTKALQDEDESLKNAAAQALENITK